MPRVALFTDTFNEANGVATLSRHLVQFARNRQLPFLAVYGGNETRYRKDGCVEMLELRRGAASFPVDKTLYFDPFLTRHKQLVLERLQAFKPDLVHLTGPGDIGFLAVLLAHTQQLVSVASWHTNLHEYLARRLDRLVHFAPEAVRTGMAQVVEKQTLRALVRFYKSARFVLAPNQEMVDLLRERNGRPAFLMRHGVDLTQYSTAARPRREEPFCIGYVGRLTTEKNVRRLAEMERTLQAAGERNYKFLIVGEGGQQEWLAGNLRNVEMTGVLRGDELAAAYQQMDAFVFPSLTDTFGLVILEAMASGVPVLLSPEAGERVGVKDGVSGFLSQDFTAGLRRLMHDPELSEAMGRAARQFALSQSWDGVFEDLYETYAEGWRREVKAPVLVAG